MKCASVVLLIVSIAAVNLPAATPDNDTTGTLSTDSLKSSLTVLPAVFYTPETKLGFGIYPNYIFRFSKNCRPSNLSFLAYYTINKQISISADPNLYFKDNRYILTGTLFYEKWPNGFFGFGTGVSKDDSEDYTTRNTGLALGLKRKIYKEFYVGLRGEYVSVDFLEMEEGGELIKGDITGAEDGKNGGAGFTFSWVGYDNSFYPGSGEYLELKSSFYGRTAGGDYTYSRLILDLRKYVSVNRDNIFAFQLCGDFINGDASFRNYSQIGGVIRGYLPTLYIGKKLLAAQIEYRRVPIWRRFGVTFFAGAGSVARDISDFGSSKFKFAAGIGFRYVLVEAEKLNIRIDYGIGQDSEELYLNVGEAF